MRGSQPAGSGVARAGPADGARLQAGAPGGRRVLHLIDTGGPGGAETVFLTLVQRLTPRWENVVVVPDRDWLYRSLVERGFSPVVLGARGAFDVRYLAGLVNLIRRQRVHVIQTHLFRTAVYGSLAARISGVPMVSTIHGIVDIGESSRMRNFKLGLLDRRRTRVVLVSDTLGTAVRMRRTWRHDVLRVILNGIDVAAFDAAAQSDLRREFALPADCVLVGAVGNVRAPKDYGNLLDAAAILRQRSPRYRILVVGDTEGEPALFAQLEARRRELGLEDTVHFCGFRADVPSVLRQLDIFVMSSIREGLPLAMLQAMAAGTAVVSTRCGGPQEVIDDGRDGLLVDTSSPLQLADAIDTLATDPARRKAMASAGQSTVRARFTIERMIEGYEALYGELLERTR